jgi:hypothetical protein
MEDILDLEDLFAHIWNIWKIYTVKLRRTKLLKLDQIWKTYLLIFETCTLFVQLEDFFERFT